MNSNTINRLTRSIILAFVITGIVSLWIYFSPGADWQNVRNACYIVFGSFLLLSSFSSFSGLLLLGFCAPLISVIPLYLTKGSPYPIALFAEAGFVTGWLINGIIKPDTQPSFKGRGWLIAFAAITLISTIGTFFRYCPTWMWNTSTNFLSEIVNNKNMTRIDAVRYSLFVFANVSLGILIVCAAQNILTKAKNKFTNVQNIIVWTILIGGVCAAAFAIYQEMNNIMFCANKAYYWIRLKRVNGTCTDPNALGAFISLCVTISLLKIVFSGANKSIYTWIQRLLAIILTFVFLLAIQYSGSRTALLSTLLALSCAVFVSVYYYTNILTKNIKHSGIIKLLIVVLMIGIYAFGISSLPKAINYVDKNLRVTSSSTSLLRRIKRDIRIFKRNGGGAIGLINDKRRLLYWKYATIMWKDYPFAGIGLGAYVVELPNYTAERKERLFRVDNACNYYLHYGAEMGAPAILFMGMFFGTLIFMMIKGIKKSYHFSNSNIHQKLVLLIALPIYLIILIFGVHTLAYEFNIAFSILLGVAASYQDSPAAKEKTGFKKDIKYIVAALVVIMLAFYIWRIWDNNNNSLNSERRQAAYNLKVEKGWGKWEKWTGVPFQHRWIKKNAHITLERKDVLLGFPIISSNPNLADEPQTVSFYVNGDKITDAVLDKPGEWKLIKFPTPYANAFIHSLPARISVRIEVDKLWKPSSVSTNEDVRSLGITVGKHRWLTPEGDMGGWYGVDFLNDMPFWWSGKYAWRKVPIGEKHKMKIPFSAANILLKWWPLDVAVYFNNEYIDTITFRNKSWKNYTYPIPEKFQTDSTGIVEFITSRTWIPKHYGFNDTRDLGIAVGEIISE